ncbi:MAG: porin [Methylobacter sp.]|nr:porin [Methylobacter sp.]
MKISKLNLAIATVLGASVSAGAMAMDLYVDTKTKQIYAEPGKGRELMGNFEKVAPAKAAVKVDDQAEIKSIREDLALKENAIKALEEHAKEASAPSAAHVKLDDGIHFATNDGNFTAGINGRIQVDTQTNFQNLSNNFGAVTGSAAAPVTLNDGAGIRRGRLGVEGTFFKNTFYKFEYDFARGATPAGGITDAYIAYNFSKPFSVKVGAFKEPFSMEEATSNRYTTFIQRNMAVDTFVDNLNTYKVGIGANYAADRWQTGVSLQTEANGQGKQGTLLPSSSTETNNRKGGTGDTAWELNGRVTGTPWMESKTKFLHVGASGSYISLNNNYAQDGTWLNGGISFANGLGGNVDRSSILDTGALSNANSRTGSGLAADRVTRGGLESALVYGPFSVQAEYIQTNVLGKGYKQDSQSLDGYYGYATYFLTGESRNYKSKTGAWDRIKPTRNFDMKGGWGAWEIATGYDYMNLETKLIHGGRANTVKAGVNWYPNSHVRVMANLVHVLDISTANAASIGGTAAALPRAWNNADLDMIDTRVQLDW